MTVNPQLKLLTTASWQGRPISGDRVKTLLRILAEAGPRGLSTQALIEAIWTDTSPAHPTKALQIVVSRARAQTASEAISRTDRGYRLALPKAEVDIWAQAAIVSDSEAALAAGKPAEAENMAASALRLADSPRARRVLALALAKQGQHSKSLPLFHDLIDAKPYDEELAAAYLRALAGTEGAAAALDKYAAMQQDLLQSLGSSPGPQLLKVHRELLALDQPVRSGLRFAATSLLGRNDDVAKLSTLLASARLVSIIGPGGLGKTRLAQEIARSITNAHVHVVELAPVRRPEDVIVAVAEALQLREPLTRMDRHSQKQDLQSRLLAQLHSGPHFLVLDNCEHVIDGVTSLVHDLLTAVADLRILATSRTPLRLTAEHIYALEQLSDHDATELFKQRAMAARSDVILDDTVVAGLVRHLDGLPLAIELAAARTRTYTVQNILHNLTHRFDLLRTADHTAPQRHQTLLAVIDWSWQLLDERSQQALMFMAVLPDSFTEHSAKGVLGSGAMVSVENLVDQSLVSVLESDGHVRFRMLETIREYGLLKLQESGMQNTAEDAVEDWGFQLCSQAALVILGTDQIPAVTTIRAEEPNLTYVLRRLLRSQDDRAVTMLAALLPYWMVTGAQLNIVAQFDSIEKFFASWQPTVEYQAAARQALAVVATTWGILPRWKDLPNSLGLLRELGADSADGIVRGLSRIGIVIIEQSQLGPITEHSAPVEMLVHSQDRYTSLLAIPLLAGIQENAGDLDGAIALLEHVVDGLDEHDPPWLTVRHRELLSQLHLQIGNFAAAKRYAELALLILTNLGNTTEITAVLACAALNLGQLDEAEEHLRAVLDSEQEEDSSGSHYMLIIGLAEIALAKGQTEYGLALLDQTLTGDQRRVPLPGMPTGDGLDPWNLLKYGAVTAAYAQHAVTGNTALFTTLLHKAQRATAQHREYFDFPVLGTVAFALAAWGHYRGGMDVLHIITLTALARRLRYNRIFPSLKWENLVAGLSEEQRRQVRQHADDLEPWTQAEVMAKYHDCLSTIASADRI